MAFSVKLIETYPGFGPELTTDGNMEDAPATNWPGTNAAVAANTANVHGGCQSLSITAAAALGYASQSVTVEPGHKYRIGVWGLRSAAGHQWRLSIYIAGTVRWTGAWHNNVAWEEEVKFYRIPNTITTIQLRLEVDTLGDVVYIDDVTMKREAPVPMTSIDLFYSAYDTWAMLEKGFMPNDPERREIWGGHLEDQLVRQEDGKRIIPLKLHGEWTTPDALIDDVNELEEVLRRAARYRKDGWGGEVFLEFQLHSATYGIWYPVCSGQIDKSDLMNACASIMTGTPAHRETRNLVEVGVTLVCEPYWESPYTYDLANLLDNPGFEEWPTDICDNQPDCWTDHESLAAGTGVNNQETDTVEEGCKALRIEVAGINNMDYKGVCMNLGAGGGGLARVSDDVQYTLLVWVQNAVITNGVVNVHVQGSVTGLLGTAINEATAHTAYTIHSCQFTPSGGDAAGTVWVNVRILATADGCSGIARIDKMLVMESSNVPTGWMSSSYLMNHLDWDAGHINYLSVCDVPGEMAAEIRYYIDSADAIAYMRVAKRTRDAPCSFVWQLLPIDSYTTADAHRVPLGLLARTDGACIDSLKDDDATAPGAHRVTVTFAGDQTMRLRCYWNITDDLLSYYGKYAFLIVAKMSGATDTASLQVQCYDGGNSLGRIITKTVSGTSWKLKDGWEVLGFRIGTADDDLFRAGNSWLIRLWASTNGTPTDSLHIATAYLVALDEAYSISGSEASLAATTDWILKDMDGDHGCFAYSAATNRYLPNIGVVGRYPLLEPEIENWLYFVVSNTSEVWTYDDVHSVSLTYRPRGIFLRGSNP